MSRTNTLSYYQDHNNEYDELQVDEDEEYQEDLFLQRHYGQGRTIGGLGLVDDDDSEDDDVYNANYSYQTHQNQHHRGIHNNFHHSLQQADDDEDDDERVEPEDDYSEVDMSQHNIQLLNGSLSVRSPFLDAIREEEDEEPVFTKPSSYPSLGSGRHFQRLSNGGLGDGGHGAWGSRSSLGVALADKQLEQQRRQRQQQQQQQQEIEGQHQQQANFNNTNQSDNSKPRGPRPPLQLGRPRANTSTLTRLTTGFDVAPSSITTDQHDAALIKDSLRDTQMSPENPIQDMEVKRVLEGAAALASASASASSMGQGGSNGIHSADSTPLPSSANVVSLSSSSMDPKGTPAFDDTESMVSFGQDTQKSIDDFFGMVKSDLDKRIQEAIQEVEQKFLHRVQRLEEHTAALSGVSSASSSLKAHGTGASVPKPGSLMESLTKPLPLDQNPGGSLALRKEILSHVTEKVGDLDLRVNQMEVLVSYKLVDIESKVQDLHGAHKSIAQKVHQVAKSHKSNMQGVRAGDGVGEDTITAEETRVTAAIQPYRDIDEQGRGAEAYLESIDSDIDEKQGIVSIRGRRGIANAAGSISSNDLADASSSIVELRNELQVLGMRYQELNDGMLTNLMGQMRDAKLMLFQTVDEVDGRISKRVDRIEAEMHSKLLSEIEGRVQERVRAMEQTSARLEKCFDRMEGRLGALETVLASRRPRPESMYQLLQQQLQQQQSDEENGVQPEHAGTFAGFMSSSPSDHQSVISVLSSPENDTMDIDPFTRPRHCTLVENDTHQGDTTVNGLASVSIPESHDATDSALVSNPLERFFSPIQARSAWSPTNGISSSVSTHSSSHLSSSAPLVASPLERGTVIGSRMGTIHPEYTPRTTYAPSTKEKQQHSVPATPVKERFQGSAPTTPITERFQAAISSNSSATEMEQTFTDQPLKPRRVSLTSFDANSFAALKPVRPSTPTTTTATATATACTTAPSGMSVVTTVTAMNTNTARSSSPVASTIIRSIGDNGRSISPALKTPTSASSIKSAPSVWAPPKLTSASSSSNVSCGISSNTGTTKTMQRAKTFDALNIQATSPTTTTVRSPSPTTAKTIKPPVQGPSSYRDLLHFWKAGGGAANSNSAPQAAAV